MTRRGTVGVALATTTLLVSGAIGLVNGIREIGYSLTPLQRSVSTGVLMYGIAGLAGGMALVKRHRSAMWLTTIWGVVVTYVASFAAIAYAGADATLLGAIASGVGTALIAAGVIWVARRDTRAVGGRELSSGGRATPMLLLLTSVAGLGACRQLYGGPPVLTERTSPDRQSTKVVRAKQDPNRLIAQDLSVCWVAPHVFASIRAGDHWRCDWRLVPEGQ